jgi:hypothetical protein
VCQGAGEDSDVAQQLLIFDWLLVTALCVSSGWEHRDSKRNSFEYCIQNKEKVEKSWSHYQR